MPILSQPRKYLRILDSIAAAAPHLRHVRIDAARLAEICAGIAPDDLKLPAWDFPVFYRRDPDALAGQILLFNAVNFCYWGDPAWEVEFRGEQLGGSLAMLACIYRALDAGLPLLDGAYLARLSAADFAHILRGEGRLHLLDERLAIWRAVGRATVAAFGGKLTGVIQAAAGDAPALVRRLIAHFPSFDDAWPFAGKVVPFYKRAQLAAAMLFEAFGGAGWGKLTRTDRLTVFADYKLPQVLRRLGILRYDAALAETIRSRALIPAGDRREVEIRIATIWAAELMRQELARRVPGIAALHLDYWLWYAGRQQGPEIEPYHRTLTTAY
jgi:hypothetical protein